MLSNCAVLCLYPTPLFYVKKHMAVVICGRCHCTSCYISWGVPVRKKSRGMREGVWW